MRPGRRGGMRRAGGWKTGSMSIGENLSPIRTLDRDTVWQLLEQHPYGRLAVEAAGLVDIFPVNYVVHQHKLYFRTAQGSKLSSLIVNDQVAFEIDEVSEEHVVRSVVVHGKAQIGRAHI